MLSLMLTLTLTTTPHAGAPTDTKLTPTSTPAHHSVTEASSPWTGERGKDRILGLSLTGSAAVLSLVALALFASAAALPTGYAGCDPRYGYCNYPYNPYGYGYAAPSPWPYVIAGLLSLGGAGAGAAFGIPMLLRGFTGG
jgi:hypothetical protein